MTDQLNKDNRNDEFIDLTDFFATLKKKWKWFPISIFFFLLLGFLYIKIASPVYQIDSKILIKTDKSGGLNSTMISLTGLDVLAPGSDPIDDKVEIIKSHTIITQMIRELGLDVTYTDKSSFLSKTLYKNSPITLSYNPVLSDTITEPLEITITKKGKNKPAVTLTKNDEKLETYTVEQFPCSLQTSHGNLILHQAKELPLTYKYLITVSNIYVITESYLEEIDVNSVSKSSSVIYLSMRDKIRARGEDVLNKIVELYNLDAVNDKNMTFQSTAEFLEERLDIIEKELEDVEKSVEEYKKGNNIADIESQAKLLITQAGEYEIKLLEIETQLSLVNFIEDFLKKEENYAVLPANLGITDEALMEQIIEYNKLIIERSRMLRSTNTENPVVKQIEEQLQIGSNNIIKSIKNIKSGIEITKKEIKSKINENSSKIKNIPTQEKEYVEIKRQQQIKESLYLFLLQKREETALSLAITTPVAKTIDKAQSSIKPVAPRKLLILLILFALGCLTPLVAIFIYSYLDKKIKGLEDLKKMLDNVPLIGEVSLHDEKEEIVVKEGSHSPISEMFRIVRTNLSFYLNGNDKKVVVVTSTISGEGKSFNAINLAMSFALTNKKVLIVGLDVRNPQLSKYMHLKSKTGVTNFISNQSMVIDDIIQESGLHPSLYAIVSGTIPPNPSELLLNSRLDDMFLQLREKFDYIILDTAPVGIVTDTFLIDRVSDATIYVCKQNFSEKPMVKFVNQIHAENRLKNLTVLLNGTNGQSSFGYGYGYGQKNKSKK